MTALASIALSVSLAASAGTTQPHALEVSTTTCPSLDTPEIQRLVELELAAVTQAIREGPPLAVSLVCDPHTLRIVVVDPLTDKRLERTLPAVDDEPGQERVIALAIGQLFAASWLELLLADPEEADDPAPDGPDPEPDDRAATEAAQRLAKDRIAVSTAPPLGFELLAGAGIRARALESDPLIAGHFDVEARGWLRPSVGLVGRVGFDYGQARRSVGRVTGLGLMVGGGLGWRWRARPAVGLGGAVVLSGGFARVQGRPSRAGTLASQTSSGTGEAVVSIGPRFFAKRLRIDLDVEVGGALRPPVGLVQGEAPVSMGGVFAGGGLRIGADASRSASAKKR